MRVDSINNNTSIYSLYSTMFQSSLSINNLKINKSFFPKNKAQGVQSLGEDALKYVINIKSASKNLSSSLKELSNISFAKKTAVSSDPDELTVKYTGSKTGDIKQTTVKIDQLAAGQLNEGKRLNADAAFGTPGTNKFSVSIGGITKEISINVAAGDSNSVVQQKMADAINKTGIGITAMVETDMKNNASMLKIESTGTGNDDKNKFTITDISGDLAMQTGANDISREARDALYSVDGGERRSSRTNTVDLGGGLNVTFNKASGEAITISAGKDVDYAKSAVEGLVKTYNDLFIEAAQKTNDPKAQNLATKMVNISKTYSGALSNMGIGFDSEGRMTIDAKKLEEAAENGSLEKFFTENSGKNYGFTNQLARLSENISLNTSNYVNRSTFWNDLTENFTYSGYGSPLQYNYLSTGWLFDYSF